MNIKKSSFSKKKDFIRLKKSYLFGGNLANEKFEFILGRLTKELELIEFYNKTRANTSAKARVLCV
jgi:hypothetical protein